MMGTRTRWWSLVIWKLLWAGPEQKHMVDTRSIWWSLVNLKLLWARHWQKNACGHYKHMVVTSHLEAALGKA